MKVSQKLAILIKHLYLSKQYGAQKLLTELPDSVGSSVTPRQVGWHSLTA